MPTITVNDLSNIAIDGVPAGSATDVLMNHGQGVDGFRGALLAALQGWHSAREQGHAAEKAANLAEMKTRHDAETEALKARHEGAIASLEARHRADLGLIMASHQDKLDKIKASHRAELDAMQTTIAEQKATIASLDAKADAEGHQAKPSPQPPAGI